MFAGVGVGVGVGLGGVGLPPHAINDPIAVASAAERIARFIFLISIGEHTDTWMLGMCGSAMTLSWR